MILGILEGVKLSVWDIAQSSVNLFLKSFLTFYLFKPPNY